VHENVFSIVCACAETADQGHKNEEEIVFSLVCACAETADQGHKNEEEIVISIVCACAETADQGLKTGRRNSVLHRVSLRRKQLIKVSKTKKK
jgi:hypothetical protein